MKRIDGRQADEMRTVKITRNYLKYAEGSVLIEVGNTKVICAATIEEKVPHFMKGSGSGWVNAEYALLPRSTQVRNVRESAKGKVTGRTQEIQRLIGRALRSVVNLKALGERTIWIDCDVVQAGIYTNTDKPFPVKEFLAAVSIGVSKDGVIADLCYDEDSSAIVDMNVVMTGSGEFVEVQGTGEKRPFSRSELNEMLAVAEKTVGELIDYQKDILGPLSWKVGRE